MVDSTCKHDGILRVVRTEYYSYALRPNIRDPETYLLDWMSGEFEEGGEFEEEVGCGLCGLEVCWLSDLTYEED